MPLPPTRESMMTPRALRLWPGVLAASLILPVRFLLPLVWPDGLPFAVLGSVVCGLAVMVWWTFFSRAPRTERWGGLALMIAALAATWAFADVSMSTGAMGMLVPLLAIPVLGVTLAVWAVASGALSVPSRRASMAATILLSCGLWTLVRTDGMTSSILGSDFGWRWTPTAEERLLADATAGLTPAANPLSTAPTAAPAPAAVAPPEPLPGHVHDEATEAPAAPATSDPVFERARWPGFRGPGRNSVVRGVRIETDWAKSPPTALWRRPIGPGWSSFAVSDDLIYTQEQRGEDEIVACYKLSTGEPVWAHRDRVRFWESNGGAGPRGTPTLSRGRVYAFGATGILNALDARSGAVIWSRNVASETKSEVPMWGFSSSPLVIDEVVVVAATGTLAGYDAATGKPRWVGPRHGGDASYSSPQLLTIGGVPQILLLSEAGATSVAPADGTTLWDYSWPALGGAIVQPQMTADGDVLISSMGATGGNGIRRMAVARAPGGWTAKERWTSSGLKPYFNDFVVHKGHAFGFDGNILAAIDLQEGTRTWKGGRYGNGQLVLLADQDLLLVISEEGELALVSATPDKYTEVARVPAIEGKTWNHPVLVGDVLLVRNGEEMAAFRLTLIGR